MDDNALSKLRDEMRAARKEYKELDAQIDELTAKRQELVELKNKAQNRSKVLDEIWHDHLVNDTDIVAAKLAHNGTPKATGPYYVVGEAVTPILTEQRFRVNADSSVAHPANAINVRNSSNPARLI